MTAQRKDASRLARDDSGMASGATTSPALLFHRAERRTAVVVAVAGLSVGLLLSAVAIEWALGRRGDTSGHFMLFGVPLVLVATLIVAVSAGRIWLGRKHRELYGDASEDAQ